MKYWKFVWLVVLLTGIVLFLNIKVFASDYSFVWENTNIVVPVYGNMSEAILKPSATLYFKGNKIEKTYISYQRTGTGLYLLADVDTSVIGKYFVMFKAYEYYIQTGNCDGYSQLITFDVRDLEAPDVELLKEEINLPYTLDSYDYQPFLLARDNVEVKSTIVDDSRVEYGKLGSYEVGFYVSDGYNVSETFLLVNIVDEVPPEFIWIGGDKQITLEYKRDLQLDFSQYIQAHDAYDGDITKTILASDYELNVIGKQEVELTATDTSGNTITTSITLNIVDKTPPCLILQESTIFIDFFAVPEDFGPLTYVLEVSDNYSALIIDDIEVIGDIDKTVGDYEILYRIKDEIENETSKILVVSIRSLIAPIIKVEHPTIVEGENIDYLKYIDVRDESDPHVEKTFEIVQSNLDIYTPGKYYTTIAFHNSSGKYAYENMIITVSDSSNELELKSNTDGKLYYFLISAIVIGGVIVFVLVLRKKQKGSEF